MSVLDFFKQYPTNKECEEHLITETFKNGKFCLKGYLLKGKVELDENLYRW